MLSLACSHRYSLLFPLSGLGTLTLDQGDFAGAVAPLERGLELCRTKVSMATRLMQIP